MDDVKLQRTTMPIGSLVDSIDRKQLRLPEIQRDYVWKPPQIAGLLDSLYREYPSGSILLWETDEDITERRAKIEPTGAAPTGKAVQYLLDGQQRVTSLHRVFHDPNAARVVFNIETERFQIESAATARDPRWVSVSEVLRESDLFGFVDRLSQRVQWLDRSVIGSRLGRLQGVSKYPYHVEIISNLPYHEVTEIFIRVNSKGRALKTTDLALATLSAKWRGVMGSLEDERDHWKQNGYPAIDLAFLARCIAAIATESRSLAGFKDTPQPELQAGWELAKKGIRHLVSLLDKNAGIETSSLIPSSNALIPLVAYLGTRADAPLPPDDARALLYWLFGAFLTGRYNQSGDTRIAEDAKAVREASPIGALYANLGLLGSRLDVTEQALAGKGAGSPFFLLSYLAARKAGATDWYYAVRIGLDASGGQAIEYHHIHPQATLKSTYSKAEINDLANLAFISARANKRISNRSPAAYFPELADEELQRHFVPLDQSLRTVHAYPDFVRERRGLLATAMTDFLDAFRPALLAAGPAMQPPQSRLIVNVYSRARTSEEAVLEFRADHDSTTWIGTASLADVNRFLADAEAGLAAGLPIDGDVVTVEGGQDVLEAPIGPFLITGTVDEWRAMVAREVAHVTDIGEPAAPSGPWSGERTPVAVAEAE